MCRTAGSSRRMASNPRRTWKVRFPLSRLPVAVRAVPGVAPRRTRWLPRCPQRCSARRCAAHVRNRGVRKLAGRLALVGHVQGFWKRPPFAHKTSSAAALAGVRSVAASASGSARRDAGPRACFPRAESGREGGREGGRERAAWPRGVAIRPRLPLVKRADRRLRLCAHRRATKGRGSFGGAAKDAYTEDANARLYCTEKQEIPGDIQEIINSA